MKNLYIEKNGSVWKLYVVGATEEVEQRYNSLYNWNAVDSFDEMPDGTRVCWTSPERMMKYFTNINLFKIVDNAPTKFKGQKGGALGLARQMALLDIEELPERPFRRVINETEYAILSASAEKPDLDLKDYFISRSFKA